MQVKILMACPIWNKIRLLTLIVSHFRLSRSPKC